MTSQSVLTVSALTCLLTLAVNAHASNVSMSPVPGTPPAESSSSTVNTSAPAVNATVTTVIPPVSAMTSSVLTNFSLSSLGFTVGAAASQFNVSFPVQAENTTISPLATHNASIASLLPQNATQDVGTNNSGTLLVADPSWGAAFVVNASSLNSTQVVVSNTTSAGSTTVFTTVYNTTTVVQNDNTQTTPWQHSVCTVTFQEQSVWQPTGNGSYNASVSLVVRSTTLNDTIVPWTLSFANAGGYTGATSTYGLADIATSDGIVTGRAVAADQTLLAQAGNAPNFDFILSSSFVNFNPVNVTVNGDTCAVIISSNITNQPLPNVTTNANVTGSAETESAGGLTTSNGQITDYNGNVILFKGLNWFGFDDGNTGPDGLWAGSNSLTQDFANIMLRIKALGFNAVRLPFSFKDLNSPMKAFGRSCSFVSGSDLAASTVPGGTNVASGAVFPSLSEPPQRTQTLGVCSDYLDVGTTFNRLVYVVKLLTHNGFYVLLDNQFNLDTTVLDNQNQWLSDWVTLLKAVAQDSVSSQMLMIDVLNEPDVFGVRWEAANGKPGYANLCIQLMDAVHSIVPGALFFVEGTGQYAPGYDGLAFNYGDGLASSSAAFNEYRGISDAGLFFEQVLSKPYLSQVVAAPHVYPPSISEAHDKFTGSGLFNRLSLSFGYLNKQGYCSRSNPHNCHQFPVVIGETGTTFALQADQQQMADFALYLNNQGAGNDGQHNPISSWFWWAWNANSGDTGGIVEADWTTINWTKINYMISLGLNPWYRGQSADATLAVPAGACFDTPPNNQYTCAQQAGWGKCSEAFMSGFCDQTCGRCTAAAACTDTPPNSQYTCAQQAGWSKCSQAFMAGFCDQSCGRCQSTAAPTTPAVAAASCTDIPPNNQYTCTQQAGWGKCSQAFMSGFCDQSCGRCTAAACTDTPPNSQYTCAQQAGWGKCSQAFLAGFCDQSCGRCQSTAAPTTPAVAAASCTDIPPNNQYTCTQQAGWGKCNEAFMSGFCAQSCNRCSSACTDTPPTSQYTCQQQAGWGKCNEAFMTSGDFCQITCGRCSACSDNPPDSVYTCAQQVGFGKCSESWMLAGNFCEHSCGQC
ncbi:TPA: hypothetical protein ACH3X1_012211 [Trebouxia sp. C0004]